MCTGILMLPASVQMPMRCVEDGDLQDKKMQLSDTMFS